MPPFWVYQTPHMPFPYPSDTIAAIATAPGEGAISIVRVSGPETYSLADRLFQSPPAPPSARPPGTFAYGTVVDPASGEVLDEAICLFFRAPHSYTGENSVEIQCHGGSQVAQRILQALLSAGARQAEPGEFTKRAFLNDKLNLTQAEAVLDLIHARSERAARLATSQLENALGLRIRNLYDALLAASADLEAMLDFPDDELPQSVPTELAQRLASIATEIQALMDTWKEGHVLREGARIVIAGAPNVGKSTLLNRLAGHDRSIVSPHPGTTRDTIEESLVLRGYPVQVTDTAGLREAPCEIEQEGIRRTLKALSQADLCLCLVDASKPLSTEELNFLSSQNHKKTIVILNKSDLGIQVSPCDLADFICVPFSLKNNSSMDPIVDPIISLLVDTPAGNSHECFAISSRHHSSLSIALENVMESISCVESGNEIQFLPAATHARAALEQVSQILGKNFTEEVLDTIFSRFCVGK